MDDKERSSGEYDLLYLYGFHEVKGLEGAWQRGRAGVDVPVGAKIYSLEEALEELVKEERGEQDEAGAG
jgi:hypothetical protein